MSEKDVELRELVLDLCKLIMDLHLLDLHLDEHTDREIQRIGKVAEKLFEETQGR